MGHLTLLAEEVQKFLENCPSDVRDLIDDSFVQSEWDAFRDGPLRETKERDSRPLAGSKPREQTVLTGAEGDRQDSDSDDDEGILARNLTGAPLTRSPAHTSDEFGKEPHEGEARRLNDNQVSFAGGGSCA
jgi:SIT4-associating protein SAP185/190